MDKALDWLSGKKTYIIAIITAILGVMQANGTPIPEYVWPLLGAFGLGTLRAGVQKSGPQT